MAIKADFWKLTPLPIALAAFAAAVPAPAVAAPLPYGPDTCISGLVWREARTGDTVCVTPAFRDRTALENSTPGANKNPNAGSGPQSCSQGYVWREAFDGDTICVTPDIRAENKAANANAQANYQRNQPGGGGGANVVFEVTGGGTVYSINTDPDQGTAPEDTAAPWSRTATVGSDVHLLQVVAVTKTGMQGCRITVDGTVVVEQPPGMAAHCVYNR